MSHAEIHCLTHRPLRHSRASLKKQEGLSKTRGSLETREPLENPLVVSVMEQAGDFVDITSPDSPIAHNSMEIAWTLFCVCRGGPPRYRFGLS